MKRQNSKGQFDKKNLTNQIPGCLKKKSVNVTQSFSKLDTNIYSRKRKK